MYVCVYIYTKWTYYAANILKYSCMESPTRQIDA